MDSTFYADASSFLPALPSITKPTGAKSLSSTLKYTPTVLSPPSFNFGGDSQSTNSTNNTLNANSSLFSQQAFLVNFLISVAAVEAFALLGLLIAYFVHLSILRRKNSALEKSFQAKNVSPSTLVTLGRNKVEKSLGISRSSLAAPASPPVGPDEMVPTLDSPNIATISQFRFPNADFEHVNDKTRSIPSRPPLSRSFSASRHQMATDGSRFEPQRPPLPYSNHHISGSLGNNSSTGLTVGHSANARDFHRIPRDFRRDEPSIYQPQHQHPLVSSKSSSNIGDIKTNGWTAAVG